MDKEFLYKYAPLLVLSLAVIFQYNLFVTPEKLEQMRKSLLEVPVPEWKAFVEKNYELYH